MSLKTIEATSSVQGGGFSLFESIDKLFAGVIDRIKKIFEFQTSKATHEIRAERNIGWEDKPVLDMSFLSKPFCQLILNNLDLELKKHLKERICKVENKDEINTLLGDLLSLQPRILKALHAFGNEKYGDHSLMTCQQVREFFQPYLIALAPIDLNKFLEKLNSV